MHITLNDGTELILGTSRAGITGCDVVPVQSTSWGHVNPCIGDQRRS